MKSLWSNASSRKPIAVSRWLSLALVTLLLLPLAMFATQRGTVSARSLGAKAGTVSPAQTDSKSSMNDARLYRAHAGSAALAPQAGILYFVDSTGDGGLVGSSNFCNDGTGKCTLRAAIQAANLHPGDDGIEFSIPTTEPSCNVTTGMCVINLTSALPNLSTSMEINGPGADKLTVRRNTGGDYRIFHVNASSVSIAVSFSGMTISNGKAQSGGGVLNFVGTVSVSDCVISGNSAAQEGGGVFSSGGTANVTNSTISDNIAGLAGGGFNLAGGIVNVTNSSINDNIAGRNGGGIFTRGVTLSITNSTITGNIGRGGGGINNNDGHLNITNSTITDNRAVGNVSDGGGSGIGGGILSNLSPGDTYQVTSSIIALNNAESSRDVGGTTSFASGGFNLIGVAEGTTFPAATNQKGTAAAPLDPKLDPAGLKNNGGPTQTIALQPTSPAIDKGTANGLTGALTTDQRGAGFARTFDNPVVAPATGGDNTDIGAFERNPADPTPTPTPTPAPTPMTTQFSALSHPVSEGNGRVDLTVTRSGNTSSAASVSFATSDVAGTQNCNVVTGVASSRCDYETSIGTVQFAAGQTSRTISVFIIDDSYLEGPETFNVSLSNPSGAALGSPATATVTITDNDIANGANPVDNAAFFVRLHYLDFLNREPDAGGLGFWTNEITSCGANQQCIEPKRINVSAAFYISIEFQQTGYLVHRFYKASYGDASGMSTLGGAHQLPVPIVRLNEFLPDTQKIGQGVIVGQTGWEQVLEGNKQNFTAEFVQRSRFAAAFPATMTPAQFVDALFANAAITPSATDRQTAIEEFGGAVTSANLAARGRALRRVAENGTLAQQEFNRAFVLMQFFGYLRRNPNDPQDSDYTGYDFWLTKLNQFNGNFVNAEMVKAFITSREYRQRFGP